MNQPARFPLWSVVVRADGVPFIVVGDIDEEGDVYVSTPDGDMRFVGARILRPARPDEIPPCWRHAPQPSGPSDVLLAACVDAAAALALGRNGVTDTDVFLFAADRACAMAARLAAQPDLSGDLRAMVDALVRFHGDETSVAEDVKLPERVRAIVVRVMSGAPVAAQPEPDAGLLLRAAEAMRVECLGVATRAQSAAADISSRIRDIDAGAIVARVTGGAS